MVNQKWVPNAVTHVTKANFARAFQQMKDHIRESDYITVSSQKTGGGSRRWHRVLPIDTPHTAYLKCKLAAETYEVFQFAVCPFKFDGSNVVDFPYNFLLFPRDELNIGMPSYSFSCQSSFLTSMARQGFDFNACVHNGISYLSRAQESIAKEGSTIPRLYKEAAASSLIFSAVDKIFIDRIKSKVQHWKNVCKEPTKTDVLLKTLRKLIVGSELLHGSRPCLNIDICNHRQVQLVTTALNQSFDDVVPIVIPSKDGEPKMVRAVLTSSEEDKNLLVDEVRHQEEEHKIKIHGFREIIELISNSGKPIIGYDCLKEFTYIHSRFLDHRLPPTMDEFMYNLKLVFPYIFDVEHLMKKIGPLRKAKSLPASSAYLRRQFFAPIDMEVPLGDETSHKNHGHEVLRTTHVFVKLISILNIKPCSHLDKYQHMPSIEEYANIFIPCCNDIPEPDDTDVEFCMDEGRKVKSSSIVFLWGFKEGRMVSASASSLKVVLHGTHGAFSEDFDLRLIDKSCAVVVFSKPSLAKSLLEDMGAGSIGGSIVLSDLLSKGLKVAGYDAYKRVCEAGLWHSDLADALNKIAGESKGNLPRTDLDPFDLYWPDETDNSLNGLFFQV